MGRKRKTKGIRSPISTNSIDMHLNNQRKNRFDILSKIDRMNVDTQASTSKQAAAAVVQKPQKAPPVIIDSSVEFTEVVERFGNDGYFFRRTSLGTKIFSENMEKYLKLLRELKFTDYRYHTHKVVDSSNYKMVLKGLHKVPTGLIKEELQTYHGVTCIDIKEIITQKSSQNDALYLLTFNRKEVNKKILYKIKYIQNISINWQNQKSAPNRGPTQCQKCGVYGHGTENCFRQAVCFLCSSTLHDASSCIMNNNADGKIYKCFNCVSKGYANVAHKADDPNCPCRASYLEARKRATNKNTANQRRQAEQPAFNLGNQNFPQLPNANSPQGLNVNDKTSYANHFKQNNVNQNDLFSMDQLFTIFQNATIELQKCSTKLEQLSIIMGLLKYGV